MSLLRGVCVISLTPFKMDGALDLKSLRNLLEFYLKAGVHGVTLLGIMGEASRLTERERGEVITTAVETIAGRVPVTVGCSAPGTYQAQLFVRQAVDMGADAVMVAPPNQTRNLDLVFNHYQQIGEVSDIPLVIQDEPVTTGVVLPASFFARVVNCLPSARYVKVEESPTLPKITQILEASEGRLGLFGGLGGMYFFEELQRGAIGIMTGFAYPDILAAVYELHHGGDVEKARQHFYRYLPLVRYEAQLGVTGVAIRKLAYQARGAIDTAYVRQPAPRVDSLTYDELMDLVQFLGLDEVQAQA